MAKRTATTRALTSAPASERAARRRPTSASVQSERDAWARDDGYESGRGTWGQSSYDRDMTPTERLRAVRMSRVNYKRSGVYGQIVDTLRNFIVGDGVQKEYESDSVGEWMKKVLEAPANAWDRELPRRVTAWLVDGERVNSYTVPLRGESPGGSATYAQLLAIGCMEPDAIEKTRVARVNHDHVLALVMKEEDTGKSIEYPTIVSTAQEEPPKLHDNGDGTATAVQFMRINVLGRRGLPYLSRSLDKATALDAAVDELARKIEYTSRFWLHATYETTGDKQKDAKLEADLLAWLKSWTPGEAAVTTGNVKVTAIAPNLQIVDCKAFVEMLLEYILGSHGIPRMWYAAGGDTNRATAVEQGTPVHRQIDALQSALKAEIEAEFRFLIRIGKMVGAIPEGEDEEFTVTMADVATRDSLRDVNELNGIVSALDGAVASSIISPKERQAMGRAAFKGKAIGEFLEQEPPPLPGEAKPTGVPGHPETGTGDDGMGPAPEAGQAKRDETTAVPGAPAGTTPPAGAPGESGAAPVQDTALNGAQVTSLLDIVDRVVERTLTPPAAKLAIQLAFPMMNVERIGALVDEAFKTPKPEPAPVPPGLGGPPVPPKEPPPPKKDEPPTPPKA